MKRRVPLFDAWSHGVTIEREQPPSDGRSFIKSAVAFMPLTATPLRPRAGHLTLRGAAYLVFLLAVLFGSFFITLWLTEPGSQSALDNRSDAERLAAYPISSSSDLAKSAKDAELIFSRRLSGHVDVIHRIDERDVGIAGWAADREGDSTPLEILIFIAGELVATTHTAGERPDVTAALRLGLGAQTNVALSANFTCRTGDRPVVVVLGKEKQYLQLQSDPCP